MLSKLPKIGQSVIALNNDEWDFGQQFQTKEDQYEIVEVSEISEAAGFIGDLDEVVWIDTESLDQFALASEDKEEDEVTINLKSANVYSTGLDVSAYNYREDLVEFTFKYAMRGDNKTTLKVIDSLQEDIEKLLESKYR